MFLQQILQHLRREWRWTIFYTLVMTMTAVGIAMLVISFGLILKTSAMSRSFIKDKVVLFQRKTIPLVSTGVAALRPAAASLLRLTSKPTSKHLFPRKERRVLIVVSRLVNRFPMILSVSCWEPTRLCCICFIRAPWRFSYLLAIRRMWGKPSA